KRVVRGALDSEITEFGKAAGKTGRIAAVQIGHGADIVGRSERAELDLHELGGREFVLVLGLGRRVMAVALAEPANGIDGEFLLALDADAGTGGKAKNILGFNLEPAARVVCVCRAVKANQ